MNASHGQSRKPAAMPNGRGHGSVEIAKRSGNCRMEIVTEVEILKCVKK